MLVNQIYLAQHGLAVDKAEDAKRPLSVAGVVQTKAIAQALQNSSMPISNVFHSGKLRAAQTATIFASATGIPSSTISGLSPNDDVTLFTQHLNINNALYIGHLPHLKKLLAYLITGNESNHIITFQNSAVVCLQKTDTHYQLQWYLTAELLSNHFQQA